MNGIFRDMIDMFLVVYIDDILIYSHSLKERISHVCQVLQRLRDNNLYVKVEKSAFHVTTINFLGFVLTPGGVSMDKDKLTAVRNWPTPVTVKDLQRFLGFSNYYRRFIRNFSGMAAPLTALTSPGKGRLLQWNPAARAAFDTLKDLFTSAAILRQPDPALPFILEVDASEVGVGAVLSLRVGSPPRCIHVLSSQRSHHLLRGIMTLGTGNFSQ